ncbi:hypothetical protein, partial [Xanthomonas nasturtii]
WIVNFVLCMTHYLGIMHPISMIQWTSACVDAVLTHMLANTITAEPWLRRDGCAYNPCAAN